MENIKSTALNAYRIQHNLEWEDLVRITDLSRSTLFKFNNQPRLCTDKVYTQLLARLSVTEEQLNGYIATLPKWQQENRNKPKERKLQVNPVNEEAAENVASSGYGIPNDVLFKVLNKNKMWLHPDGTLEPLELVNKDTFKIILTMYDSFDERLLKLIIKELINRDFVIKR